MKPPSGTLGCWVFLLAGGAVGELLIARPRSCPFACTVLSQLVQVEINLNYVSESQRQPGQQPLADAADRKTHTEHESRPLFWAQQQQDITPACLVHAASAQDVAAVVRMSRATGCPFAVRGGGHSDRPGASNSPGGITVSLATMNQVHTVTERAEDHKGARAAAAVVVVVHVGAGATWGTVYAALDPLGYAVAGGRLTDVGVGGLLLGGGLSHFSGARGWACDGVRAFLDVVVADGTILPRVSPSSHPDLYRVLRGGGGGFAVVTRFELDVFPQGRLWGGLQVWPLRAAGGPSSAAAAPLTRALTDEFVGFTRDAAPLNPQLSLFAGLGYSRDLPGNFLWAAGQYDTQTRDPVLDDDHDGGGDEEEEPAVFTAFNARVEQRGGVVKMASTARTATLSELAEELNGSEPPGMRSRFTTATIRADADLLRFMADVFVSEVEAALDKGLRDDANFKPMLGIQPLTRNILAASASRGGNVMGLDVEDGPLIICSFGWEWSSARDDDTVIAGIQAVLEQTVAAAQDKGLYHPFKYMNYAAEDQDPLGSYGSQSSEIMSRVSSMYDPDGLFAALVPGSL